MLYKTHYKSRFWGYYPLRSLVQIADGLITLITIPFGFECDLYGGFCDWNLRKDMERVRRKTEFYQGKQDDR